MSLAIIHSRALDGMHAPPVQVEVHLANGLPSFTIVGLAETAVKESRERVRAALIESGFAFPHNRRITVNLAPADLPKNSGRFDLPIALGILAAAGELDLSKLDQCEFAGELSLAGELRPVRGAVALAMAMKDDKSARSLVLPIESATVAAMVTGVCVLGATHVSDVVRAFRPGSDDSSPLPIVVAPVAKRDGGRTPDLCDVRGQAGAKRALEVAAAGGHSMLLVGPPGSGKSMLAERLPGLLPPMTNDESLMSAAIQGLAVHGSVERSFGMRPFRRPHHTASAAALVGGGSPPRPGEISLAHGGVLFLDELPEFPRSALEALREPLETGYITLSRTARHATYDARFQLIAAMNPCACGWFGASARSGGACRCTPDQIARYRARLSGPLLDRIDIQLEVVPVAPEELMRMPEGEPSAIVRARVGTARVRQTERQGCLNATLDVPGLDAHASMGVDAVKLLRAAATRLGWSNRRLHRTMKVARTITDLASAESIEVVHVAEALQMQRVL